VIASAFFGSHIFAVLSFQGFLSSAAQQFLPYSPDGTLIPLDLPVRQTHDEEEQTSLGSFAAP
jgi:hypothetical protein